MPRTLHFISGLPRSGSTLLAGILRQNPRMHAAMSSPVAGLLNSVLEQMGAGSESLSVRVVRGTKRRFWRTRSRCSRMTLAIRFLP